ncbi:MAG: NADH-quinone oxidoreductase subunit B family protein [Candidatus Hodarchaeales archaeon]|jgi:F420-non-reducing hydrogenase small subunit
MSEGKAKIAFYWAASCGGCEVAILDTDEAVLDVTAKADIVFWPFAIDIKYKDVYAMEDKSIDVTFFNGAIRNSEAAHIAQVLRKKSKFLVAFGSCANFGGVPSLANFHTKDTIFDRVYNTTPSTTNPAAIYPQTSFQTEEGEVNIPDFYDKVFTLDDIVDVDYFLPGCPPTKKWILAGVTAFLTGELPPKGSVLAEEFALCKECPREKPEQHSVSEFKRVWEVMDIDFEKCLLEQGIICMGPATRAGCEARCITVNSPCRGCYGAPPNILDPGAKMISVLGSILDETDESKAEVIIEEIPDLAGTFYEFTLGKSIFARRKD